MRESSPVTDLDTPEPLADWLKGTLTLAFAHGATVTRRVPLSTAAEVRQVAAGTREPDRLRWYETGWLQFDSEQLVFTDFALDEDGGWPLSAEDRRTLDLTPYSRGVLVALRDYWAAQAGPEAAYSARALVTLHRNILTNPAPGTWARLARALEGQAGADRVREVYEVVANERSDAAEGPSRDAPSTGGTPTSDDLTYAESEAADTPPGSETKSGDAEGEDQ